MRDPDYEGAAVAWRVIFVIAVVLLTGAVGATVYLSWF